jgi:hypothetical protein
MIDDELETELRRIFARAGADIPVPQQARQRLLQRTYHPRTVNRRLAAGGAVAAAAALVAAGAGYGITAAEGGSSLLPSTTAGTTPAAGLTAVHGCPGIYITAGTLRQVSGTRLVVKPANDTDHVNRVWRAQPVTVATTGSTAITAPTTGTLSDITDGSQVQVSGTWSGSSLAAAQVSLVTGKPPQGSFGPPFKFKPGHLRRTGPKGLRFPAANGTVEDVHDGGFTVLDHDPVLGYYRVRVITSSSTKVQGYTRTSLSQLNLGANVVAVGTIGRDSVMTAITVAESGVSQTVLAGGPVKVRTSGCSASAITTAAVLAAG